jgi:hypothetical protein
MPTMSRVTRMVAAQYSQKFGDTHGGEVRSVLKVEECWCHKVISRNYNDGSQYDIDS